jgi:hypothetical protein
MRCSMRTRSLSSIANQGPFSDPLEEDFAKANFRPFSDPLEEAFAKATLRR